MALIAIGVMSVFAATFQLQKGMVAIPTSILSSGFIEHFSNSKKKPSGDGPIRCPHCGKEIHQ